MHQIPAGTWFTSQFSGDYQILICCVMFSYINISIHQLTQFYIFLEEQIRYCTSLLKTRKNLKECKHFVLFIFLENVEHFWINKKVFTIFIHQWSQLSTIVRSASKMVYFCCTESWSTKTYRLNNSWQHGQILETTFAKNHKKKYCIRTKINITQPKI